MKVIMKMGNNLNRKNYLWNTIGTTFLSFNSLFYLIIVTRINGIEDAGIFSLSYSFACIINVIALFYGRTYQVTDNNSEFSNKTYFVARIIASVAAIIISIGFVILNHYELEKSVIFLILCFLKTIEAVSDYYYGILQKNYKLYIAGKSLTYKSLISVVLFLIVEITFNNLFVSCTTLLIVNLLFLIFYDMSNAKSFDCENSKIQKDQVIALLKKTSNTFIFTFIVLIIINIPRYAIDLFSNDSMQAIYGILTMPATFMMLFGQFILQPSLLRIANFFHEKNLIEFNKTIKKLISFIIFVTLLILPFVNIIGIPILGFIYKIDLSQYTYHLMLIIIGAGLYAASNVFLNALITIRCTREQVFLQILTLFIGCAFSFILVKRIGLDGGVFSYFIVLSLQFVLYLILYMGVVKKRFEFIRGNDNA